MTKTEKTLVDLLSKQIEHNNDLQRTLAATLAAQAAALGGVVEMWKPPSRPNGSSSLDERLLAKEAAEASAWEPVAPELTERLFADLEMEDVEFLS